MNTITTQRRARANLVQNSKKALPPPSQSNQLGEGAGGLLPPVFIVPPTKRTKPGEAKKTLQPIPHTPRRAQTTKRGAAKRHTETIGSLPPSPESSARDHWSYVNQPKHVACGQSNDRQGQLLSATHLASALPVENEGASGQPAYETQNPAAAAPTTTIPGDNAGIREGDHDGFAAQSPCVAFVEPYARLRATMRAQLALEASLGAFARQMLAGTGDGEQVKTRAKALVSAVMKGKPSDEPANVVAMVAGMFSEMQPAIEATAASRKRLEKQLELLAQSLPVWERWAEGVRGLGALLLAKVVAECGDIGNYATPAKVWKRMGLAVMSGRRQGNPEDKSVESWATHGYCPRRRSIAWFLGECQIRNGDPEYRGMFDRVKANEKVKLGVDPDAPSAHANNRARRYVSKAILRDLWVQWRK
jgi:hypothetical protein